MLTPHQIAALIIAANAPETVDTGNPDFKLLEEKQLIHYVCDPSGAARVRVTPLGVETVSRLSYIVRAPANGDRRS
ncbi:hypothetical protein WKR88_11355 [Trinickia caryophylli]|uniref:Uncharacterized protein n=1 Tax=Trinickia caryophylli TaxID=28094 RepID=A0A1X7CUG0_TRICW|nr:hypothetical protein [Trinickia caryophylli]PMS13387.1 hypothetical protein C0Z17_03480 [Trinickia caryophylli]TRX13754.1 hypothetical protein FNF07_20475 [Trinickia caryophylli]WQE15347.1 hypothetical protein U0034_22705 [Trinickia caryophylli]SMF03290.1 hypothetical protein SAMN06295900_10217 [Trinickia caryophylli]GLU30893.1 hypothetical protein Busp01_07350 [Trinickia caryophylli]